MEFRAFFTRCTCEDDVKKVYRGLAFAHHPDKGGTAERFQLLQEEYQYQLRKMAPGYTYAERTQSSPDYEDILRTMRERAAQRAREQARARYTPGAKTKRKAEAASSVGKIIGLAVSAILRSMGINVHINFK